MGRRLAREVVFKYLFEADINKEELNSEEFYANREESQELQEEQINFVKGTLMGIKDNLTVIDQKISENMENWNLDRLGLVERALLRFATYELFHTEIGKEIILNEVIELAKKYGEDKSSEFINGVLANIIKNM